MAVFGIGKRGARIQFAALRVLGKKLAIGQKALSLIEPPGQLLYAATEKLRFRSLRDELPVELVDLGGKLLSSLALLDELIAQRLRLGGFAAQEVFLVVHFPVAAFDLSLQCFGLGAQGHQLDALTADRARALLGIDLDLRDLRARAGERTFRLRQCLALR